MNIILILLNLATVVIWIKTAVTIEDKKTKIVAYIISLIFFINLIINFIHLWYK